MCSEMITVAYEDQPGEIRQAVANLEEIASGQAVVLIEDPPNLGAPISLAIQGHDLFGMIRARVHDSVLGWFVFVSLDAASRWSPDWFAPNHLLAVGVCSPEGSTNTKVRYLENAQNTEENVPVHSVVSGARPN